MSDLLQNLVATPHAALVADADFLDPQGAPMVVFIIEDDGNLDTQLHTALGRLGVACIIDLVDGRGDAPDAYPVYMNPVSIVCEVSEKVLMNRTTGQVAGTDYLTLRQALGMIIDKLHLQHGLVFESFRSAQPPKGADAAYQIFFNTSEVLENTRRVLPVLQSLEITGSASVESDSTAQYTLTATYDDATTADVTAEAIWGENSTLATIAEGLLTVGTITTDQSASLFAAYGGISATLDITLQAAFIPVWTDYIDSIVDTVSYDAALNAIFALDNNPETFEITAPGINYSYASYYAHVGLEAAGATLTDDGLDDQLYPAEDHLNLGADVIVNGGFNDGDTGWDLNLAITVVDAVLIVGAGSSYPWATQDVGGVVGATYLFGWTVGPDTVGHLGLIAGASAPAYSLDTSVGNHTALVTWSTTPGPFYLYTTGLVGTLDNISLQQVLPETP